MDRDAGASARRARSHGAPVVWAALCGVLALAACAAPSTQPRTGVIGQSSAPVANGGSATGANGGIDAAVSETSTARTPSGPLSVAQTPLDASALPSGPLPNLTINGARIRSSAQFEWRDFGPNACDIQERCLTTPGRRRLLRFDLETPNDGQADVIIGHPTPDDPRFEFSTCHGHRHFLGYARYSLRDQSGAEVARGHKQSFCLMDSNRTGRVPGRRRGRYTCQGEQGIQAGWSDVYERNLDCQYIDVTDVPPGNYRLEVEINVNRSIRESEYADNTVSVDLTIPGGGDAGVADAGAPGDSLRACQGSVSGLDRDCGWTRVTTRSCTPGASVQVACNAGCSPALGSCTGDAMLRVCAGPNPCSHITMLGQNDDGCPSVRGGENTCPSVSFTCPPEGRYTVLTGSYVSTDTSTCNMAVR